MDFVIDKKDCSGCGACEYSCPVNCISMVADKEGFWYPVIDTSRCIDCKKCQSVCPVNKEINKGDYKRRAFVIQHTNDKIRRESTSGGAFTAIAEYVIENGGVVFGATFDDNFKVIHKGVSTKEELSLFRNSKYSQSELGDTYSQIKTLLDEGRLVLFSGTPCQVGGVRSVFDNENLITVDVVCHGIPSPFVFEKYVAWQRVKYAQFDKIMFRDKYSGYTHSTMSLYRGDKCLYHNGIEYDAMLKLFYQGLITRPVCAECHFKTAERVSDFTLWDCYMFNDKNRSFNDNKGTTNVVVHSEKGEKILDAIKDKIRCCEGDFENVCAHTFEMLNSCPHSEKREFFFKDMNILTNDELFNKYVPVTMGVRVEKLLRNIFAKAGVYHIAKKVYYRLKRGK